MDWIFVRPENNGQSSEIQLQVFDLLKEYDLNVQWITAKECLSLNFAKLKKTFFVCDPFSGSAFEHLKRQEVRIIGPRCLRTGVENYNIQNERHPIHNCAMSGLYITFTGFTAEKREQLMEKVKFMGGQTDVTYSTSVTHLVADEVGSKKYNVAMNFNTPVMVSKWVTDCWKRSQNEDICAKDPEFDKYRIPIFKGLIITLTQAGVDERKRIQCLVKNNGGVYTGELRSRHATHLIAWEPTGKKFKFANQWKIHCVTVDWLDECINKGYKVSEEPFLLKKADSIPVTSSPQDGDDVMSISSTSSIMQSFSTSTVNETVTSRNSSIWKPVEQVNSSTALDNLNMDVIYRAGSTFLDGCRIYLRGFDNIQVEKIRRIINLGGGTRLNQLSESVSHCVVNSATYNTDDTILKLECEKWRTKIVKIEWLVDSCLAGHVVDEKLYTLWEQCSPTMLPPQSEIKESKPPDMSTKEDEKILSQYLENTSQGTKSNSILMLQATDVIDEELDQSNTNFGDDQQIQKLFNNLTMTVMGFIDDSLTFLYQTIEENGGIVLSPDDGAQVPDYTIVPIDGMRDLVNVSKVATNVWLLNCVENREIISLDSDPLFQPINLDLNAKPLVGCVICISQFLDIERESLSELVVLLGAKYQDTLVRKPRLQHNLLPSTHLICKEPEGGKYNGAIRWGLPVVRKNWVTDCAAQGKWLPEKKYFVDPNQSSKPSLKDTSIVSIIKTLDVEEKEGDSSTSTNKVSSSVVSININSVLEEKSTDSGTTVRSNSSSSVVFNKSDLHTPQTVKRNTKNLERSFETLKETFTPTMSKRIGELRSGGQGSSSSGRKNESSDVTKWSTPSRFLDTSSQGSSFEPKLTFSPDDCPKKASRESMGSLEVFCRKKLQSANKSSKPFSALANVKPRESGAFFPEEHEKDGPLKGVILGVSKKLRSEQSKINDMMAALGGDYRWLYDKTCTHFMYQGRLNENWNDLKLAKARGIPIVAPEWLHACYEKKALVNENAFPSNYNPKMMLEISTSQIVRPPRKPRPQKSDESEVNDSLVEGEANQTVEAEKTSRDPEKEVTTEKKSRSKGKTPDGIRRQLGEIFNITDNDISDQPAVTDKPSTDKGEGELEVSYNKPNDGHITAGPTSQSIPILWGSTQDGKQQAQAQAQANVSKEAKCDPVVDCDETQLDLPELAVEKPKSVVVENKDSNKENHEVEEVSNKENHEVEEVEEVANQNEQSEEDKEVSAVYPSFMLSGFPGAERLQHENLIEKLGGSVSKDQCYDDNCTHLIVNQPTRNEKCLASIVSGKWMLHKTYLEESENANKFVSEEEHEWGGDEKKSIVSKFHPQFQKIAISARKWRIKLQDKNKRKPFSDWNVALYMDRSRCNSFRRILEAGGATVLSTTCPVNQLDNVTHAFIETQHSGSPKADLAALTDAKIPCLKPEYISIFVMERNSKMEDYFIPEVQPKVNPKSNLSSSKRKSDSLNGNSKRNRQV